MMREQHGNGAVLVGFFTCTGTVFAASRMGRARPGQECPASEELRQPRLERAIGVIYLPETERQSHYFTSQLGPRFDAATFFDVTRAITPLP